MVAEYRIALHDKGLQKSLLQDIPLLSNYVDIYKSLKISVLLDCWYWHWEAIYDTPQSNTIRNAIIWRRIKRKKCRRNGSVFAIIPTLEFMPLIIQCTHSKQDSAHSIHLKREPEYTCCQQLLELVSSSYSCNGKRIAFQPSFQHTKISENTIAMKEM